MTTKYQTIKLYRHIRFDEIITFLIRKHFVPLALTMGLAHTWLSVARQSARQLGELHSRQCKWKRDDIPSSEVRSERKIQKE